VAFTPRMIEGLAVAALAQGDEGGARALPGLSVEAQAQVAPALRGLARADADARRTFLRSALARPAIDPQWAARLARAPRRGYRAAPELVAYLAQLARTR
jgi:hypothetical protein